MNEWKGKFEDWRIDWVTYGGPYVRYPAWPHPENGHAIVKLSFADPTPFEDKRKRAALIAAAPDLYEALEEMMGNFKRPHRDEWLNEAGFERAINACAAAERALAKARGETN